MVIEIECSRDLTLDVVREVAWKRADIRLSPQALERISGRREQFLDFVNANLDRHLYGITTKHHLGAKIVMAEHDRNEYASRLPATPASVGPGLPERLVRTIVLARLSDVLNGTAPLRTDTLRRMLGLLDGEMPFVPERGSGEPGDIIPLGHLFRATLNGTLELGEGMAVVNGSPVASAALADATIAQGHRLRSVEAIFALSAEAVLAPLGHYDQLLETAWLDEHQASTVARFRELLEGGATVRLQYQAPVSFRSAPRVVGWARRVVAEAEVAATLSLQASSNNPIFVGPDLRPPVGQIVPNGGYHNPWAAPTMDAIARSSADLAQLAAAQVSRLCDLPTGLAATEPEHEVGLLYHTAFGWAEEARAAAQPSFIGLGGSPQTDTGTPDLLAWRHAREAGEALDATLAVLAVVAAHTIMRTDRPVPTALQSLMGQILNAFPVGTIPIDFGVCLTSVRSLIDDQTFEGLV